jgi:hypothetical protein
METLVIPNPKPEAHMLLIVGLRGPRTHRRPCACP